MQITNISQHSFNSSLVKNQRKVEPQASQVSFGGTLPQSKLFDPLKKFCKPVTSKFAAAYDKLADLIAVGYGKLLDNKKFQKLISNTVKKDIDVVKQLSVFISLIISGLYIKRTLDNDKLAPEQKSTLAINQGIVSLVATTLGYSVTGIAGRQVDKFVRKYAAVNYKEPALKSLQAGVKGAAAMMIFGTMYRYVAPVLVTPVAIAIGNKLRKNKDASAKTAAANKPAVVENKPVVVSKPA